jgi:hypothetical protein
MSGLANGEAIATVIDPKDEKCKKPHLSWQLSAKQRQCIVDGVMADGTEVFEGVLSGQPNPTCDRDQGLSTEIWRVNVG